MTGWPVEALTGDAEALHGRDLARGGPAAVWSIEVTRAALVLGSTQPIADVDRELARHHEVEVVRRRSGGGAVLLVPGEVWWCDLAVPAGDPAHRSGPGAQFAWAGTTWVRALSARGAAVRTMGASVTGVGWTAEGLTPAAATVRPAPLGRVVCFGAVGPGEVLVGDTMGNPAGDSVGDPSGDSVGDPSGDSLGDSSGPPATVVAGAGTAKLVGLSQRRTRAGARVLGLVHRVWRPELTATLLRPGLARIGREVDEVVAELSTAVRVAADIGLDADADLAGRLALAAAMPGADGSYHVRQRSPR